ncbi:GntR family transcriptional regulator [Nocardia sp. NBC_00403]|uniref:GntR family transcriptional regulator n=1 Tax=Nocardia sp. NBC_00403 TaxID=2975990 RepID=UPI002E1EE98D
MSDTNTGRAPYRQVVGDIQKKIKSGELKPGDRISSQRALADEYDIAPMTAAKAVRTLCDEGWTFSTPSLGVFVSDSIPAEQDHSLADEVRDLRSRISDLAERVERIEASQSVDQAHQ